MSHVIDEICFDLRKALLSKYDQDGIREEYDYENQHDT